MSATLGQYDRWAASYDSGDNPMIDGSAWALAQVPFECRGADVVELGCGTGRHVASVLAAGARSYLGVDGSPGMLAVARGQNIDVRARFVEADLSAPLPLADASFDRALVVLVLEHIAALEVPLREVARLLRPGGRLRIVDIHPSLVAAGTVAEFEEGGAVVRFASYSHPLPALRAALERSGLVPGVARELMAEGALLEQVPKLAKHRGKPVLIDVEAGRVE